MSEDVAPPESPASAFAELGLDARIITTLAALGYEEPTPIQREAIPVLLGGRDVLGQAATGTGKTAAFTLPLIQRAALGAGVVGGVVEGASTDDGADDAAMDFDRRGPSVLILVPTRELAMQVGEAVHKYGKGLGVRAVPVYGGQDIRRQLRALERGSDVVIATPGRALDHIRRKTLALGGIRAVVLDEADEMLDMGFAEDLEAILSETPAERQTVFFSATLPPRIAGMGKRHLKDPVRIEIAKEKVAKGAAPKVRQTAYIVPRFRKLESLNRILDLENPASALVFCRTRTEVDNLTERLSAHGYRAQPLHGGINQDQRTRVIKRLREGAIDLVVATDVAARGLDIENLELVVNYDVPTSPESYVHRIGRVGRAGREGVAITLAEPREHRMLKTIERVAGSAIAVHTVPTVADLRARRLDLTRGALRESLLGDDLDRFRVVVETLTDEFDLMEVALAAVKLAHEAAGGGADDDEEIPQVGFRPDSGKRPDARGSGRDAGPRPRRSAGGPAARLFVGVGREAGIRPGDLVGAITGETGLTGRDIGAIEIHQRFALVEVPEPAAEEVIRALKATMIKGRKATIRRDK